MHKTFLVFLVIIYFGFNVNAATNKITTLKFKSDTVKKDTLKEHYLAKVKENNFFYLTQENYYKELLLKKNMSLLFFSIGSLLFLIFFSYISFWVYRTKEKNRKLLIDEEIRFAMLEKENKFKDFVHLFPQIIFETNKMGYFTFVNQHFINKSGYKENEIYLLKINDLIYNNISQKPLNCSQQDEFETLNEKEFLLKTADDSFIPIILYINSVMFYNNYFGCRGIIFDLSYRKEIEDKIIKTIITTEENERTRISKDLHDTLGPLLSTLKLYVNELETCTSSQEKINLQKEINTMINEAVSYSREISHNITPIALKDFGIWKALNLFIQKINSLNKVEIIFKYKNEETRYDSFFEINIYRVVLELIQNSIKHSNASNIVIDISDVNNTFKLSYYDNGKGFNYNDFTSMSHGMGLLNIFNRIKTLKGSYSIHTAENEGFTFIMSCPVDVPHIN